MTAERKVDSTATVPPADGTEGAGQVAAAVAVAGAVAASQCEKYIPKIGDVFTIICNEDSICQQEEFGNFKWRRVEYKLLEGETHPRLPTMLSAVLVEGQDTSTHPHEEERLAYSEGKEDWCVHEGRITGISEARYDYWPADLSGSHIAGMLMQAFWWAGRKEGHGFWVRVFNELDSKAGYVTDSDNGELREAGEEIRKLCGANLKNIKELVEVLGPYAEMHNNPVLLDAVVVLKGYLAGNEHANAEHPSR